MTARDDWPVTRDLVTGIRHVNAYLAARDAHLTEGTDE